MLNKELLLSARKEPPYLIVHNNSDFLVQVIAWGTESTLGWTRLGYVSAGGVEKFIMDTPCEYVEISFTSTSASIAPGKLVNAQLVEKYVRVIDLTTNAYVTVEGANFG